MSHRAFVFKFIPFPYITKQCHFRWSFIHRYKKFYLLSFMIPLKFTKTALCQTLDVVQSSNISSVLGRNRIKIKQERSILNKFITACRIGFRCFILFCLYFPLIVVYPLIKWNINLRRNWWSLILKLLQHSGPIFVKFGQWASTRRDLFSQEFCNLFSHLHTRTNPHSWRYTEKMLKFTFGDDWRLIFNKFDEEPCGSGCVAQVKKFLLTYIKVSSKFFLHSTVYSYF